VNYPRFKEEYHDCIHDSFTHYYAVPRRFSKVSAAQFSGFMQRIGAPLQPAPDSVRRWFHSDLVEAVFVAEECAFDAVKLRDRVLREMDLAGVTILAGHSVSRIRRCEEQLEVLVTDSHGAADEIRSRAVLNCTYANINSVLKMAALPGVKLKHEITEMALVRMPDALTECAFTVMCGPFFSCMPFPARGLHTLSHVRYTPHGYWLETPGEESPTPDALFAQFSRRSRFRHMQRDAARYLPALARVEQVDSLWEVKTVLPQSEADDSRPILCRQAEGEPRLWSVMGGKIDNIYDAIDQFTLNQPFFL
jgi:glycine/D-amino acid oxidase-like deaminating enzyme